MRDLEHPDITKVNLTGYPRGYDCGDLICERCHNELSADEWYCDDTYDVLCEFCLKDLHRKYEW